MSQCLLSPSYHFITNVIFNRNSREAVQWFDTVAEYFCKATGWNLTAIIGGLDPNDELKVEMYVES